jgi:lysophospholipase L1-like esterase
MRPERTRLTTLVVVLLLTVIRGADARAETRMLPAPSTPGVVYVALGDSTVQGIGATSADTTYPGIITARLRGIYPDARLENFGVAGAVAHDVASGQLERAVALQPALVTLSVGPNDVTGSFSADDYARSIDTIFRTLAERTSAVVVVNLLPDLALTPRYAKSPQRKKIVRRALEVNAILKRAAAVWNAQLVDLHDASRREVSGHPELFASDGYHPSDAGYARWADLMWHGIARRLPSPVPSPTPS